MQKNECSPFSAPQGVQRPWLALTLLCVAQFMMLLDFSIVNVALPSLQRSLSLSPQNLQWVATVCVVMPSRKAISLLRSP